MFCPNPNSEPIRTARFSIQCTYVVKCISGSDNLHALCPVRLHTITKERVICSTTGQKISSSVRERIRLVFTSTGGQVYDTTIFTTSNPILAAACGLVLYHLSHGRSFVICSQI